MSGTLRPRRARTGAHGAANVTERGVRLCRLAAALAVPSRGAARLSIGRDFLWDNERHPSIAFGAAS